MAFRFRLLLALSLLLSTPALRAQDNDYLKHGKIFCLCSFKWECIDCYSCNQDRYKVKIENKLSSKISKISYKYYSVIENRILEKAAKIEGGVIDPKHVGIFHICIPDGAHWVISKIDYTDGASNVFKLHDRLDTFPIEPDECDCN